MAKRILSMDMPDNYFSDVTADMANYRDILLAVEFGVIDLDAGEAFEPDKPATREFAAQTLNFCLEFQLDNDTTYTYSEAEEVSCPDDIQVAVNRGWFALYGNDFLPKQCITAAEAEVKVGLTLSANIDLVVMSGRIWATVGVKGYFKFKDYTYVDGERPFQCKTIGGFLYANIGASASINYFVDKKSWSKTVDIYTESNSPVRVYYHYEDNQLVDCCTRGKNNNEAYIKYTTHTNSAYFNPSPSYGRGYYMGGYGLIKLSAVNVPQSCEVFIAAYGANQKVTSTKKLTLSNDSVQTIIPLENVGKLKAFIWDFKNLKPLAVSKSK